eukprot:scaffold33070_cov61-Phaeocystis_antarctica.AAC.3
MLLALLAFAQSPAAAPEYVDLGGGLGCNTSAEVKSRVSVGVRVGLGCKTSAEVKQRVNTTGERL